MSQYFNAAGKVLWNPSTGVGRLFARSVKAVAPAVELPTGLGTEINDEYEIDLIQFTAFVDALVGRYGSASHLVLRTLIEGVAATGIVLIERAGGAVVPLATPSVTADRHDVAVSTTGLAPVGDLARLRALADQLDAAMPR